MELEEINGLDNPICPLNSGKVGNKVNPPRNTEKIPVIEDLPIDLPAINSNENINNPTKINSDLNKEVTIEKLPINEIKEPKENEPQ